MSTADFTLPIKGGKIAVRLVLNVSAQHNTQTSWFFGTVTSVEYRPKYVLAEMKFPYEEKIGVLSAKLMFAHYGRANPRVWYVPDAEAIKRNFKPLPENGKEVEMKEELATLEVCLRLKVENERKKLEDADKTDEDSEITTPPSDDEEKENEEPKSEHTTRENSEASTLLEDAKKNDEEQEGDEEDAEMSTLPDDKKKEKKRSKRKSTKKRKEGSENENEQQKGKKRQKGKQGKVEKDNSETQPALCIFCNENRATHIVNTKDDICDKCIDEYGFKPDTK